MIEGLLNDLWEFAWGIFLFLGGLLGGFCIFQKLGKKGKIEGTLFGVFGCSLALYLGGHIHSFAVKVGRGDGGWIGFPEHEKQIAHTLMVSGIFLAIIYISDRYINKVR